MGKEQKRVIEIPVFDKIVVDTNGKPDELSKKLRLLGADGYQVVGFSNDTIILSRQTGVKEIDITHSAEETASKK
jgi:hypothetical protein